MVVASRNLSPMVVQYLPDLHVFYATFYLTYKLQSYRVMYYGTSFGALCPLIVTTDGDECGTDRPEDDPQ